VATPGRLPVICRSQRPKSAGQRLFSASSERAESIRGRSFRYLEPLTTAGPILLASHPTSVQMRRLEIRLGHP